MKSTLQIGWDRINKSSTCTAQCAVCPLGCPCIQKCPVSYKEASVMKPYHIQLHQDISLVGRQEDNGDILYASVSNTEPLKIARYTTLCTFWRKIENLEFETHENWIFSIFLRDVSLKKKCLSFKYFYGFFKISPGANIPEEFLVYNLRTVHWGPTQIWSLSAQW